MRYVGATQSLFLIVDGLVTEHRGAKKGLGYRGIHADQEYEEI
jgi:hypothetical protein